MTSEGQLTNPALKPCSFRRERSAFYVGEFQEKLQSHLPSASPAEDRAWALHSRGAIGSGLRHDLRPL